MTQRFQNPNNGYEEPVSKAGLLCLLFGPLYFAHKGAWSHVAISAVAAVFTGGLSWFVYPFFARRAVMTAYLRRGWHQVDGVLGDIRISR
jgi:hypothetical protein